MKIAFVVHNELFTPRVMELLDAAGIDYYTRWESVTGKGRGTEAHLGKGGTPSTNSALMIAFQEEAPLEALIKIITASNAAIKRPDDKIRLFQLPLERIV
ncbi:MAG: hypothetical protein HY525_16350 [Betaproteobacteria bacterium]|nr:hypothetical protein [Betaproteobacteria bacterium]